MTAMAEAAAHRRVDLTTLSAATVVAGPNGGDPCGIHSKTFRSCVRRFNLPLNDPTDSHCSEFYFPDLVRDGTMQGDRSVFGPGEPTSRNGGLDADVASLARQFEEKYGRPPCKKRAMYVEQDDFDLGDGYDLTDSFIDNTEAYDEQVPSCLTTRHGGFYVNKGTLDLRTWSDLEESDGQVTTPSLQRQSLPRRLMKKGQEGQPGEGKHTPATKPSKEDNVTKRKKAAKSSNTKKALLTVKELLRQQTARTAMPGGQDNQTIDPLRPQSPPRVSRETEKSSMQSKKPATSDLVTPVEEIRTTASDSCQNRLPVDMAPGLYDAIVEIKQAAKDSKGGKCKFFSPSVNALLLNIELATRQLAPGKRSAVYAHLADHLPCSKDTLLKRARKLRESQQTPNDQDEKISAIQSSHSA